MEGSAYYQSPVGELLIEAREDRIITISFSKSGPVAEHPTPVIGQCIRELDEYFFEGRKFFTFDLKLIGTDFQTRVWNELLTIPYGRTISYYELASRVGNVNGIRAVALANGQNPIAIVVPCHRVIGKKGDLVGYEGGLEKKEWLLQHEGAFSEQLKLFK